MSYQDDFKDVTTIQLKTAKEAIGTIAFLISFDERFKHQPFSNVINDIYGSVMHGYYSIAAREIPTRGSEPAVQPLAVICWGMLSPASAVIRANGIRPLAPVEMKSGDKAFFTLFSSPFEDPAKMMTLMRAKDQKLQSMDNVTFVDKLFKPDYNYSSLAINEQGS